MPPGLFIRDVVMKPVLIDANSLIVRNIMMRAIEDLEADGVFTSGIFNSIRQLSSVVRNIGPSVGPIVACFDRGVPEFRKEQLPGYKEGRSDERAKRMSDEQMKTAFRQVDDCREVFEAMGVYVVDHPDAEADDFVGAAVRRCYEKGRKCIVVSSDRDLWRAVLLGAEIFDLKSYERITYDNFRESVGVPPDLYPLYKAIVGDSSDSIEGVPGCGDKRARSLVQEIEETQEDPHTHLENLVEVLRDRENPKKHESAVFERSVWLSTVISCTDVFNYNVVPRKKVIRTLREAKKARSDHTKFRKLCKRYDFKSILSDTGKYLYPIERTHRWLRRKQK